VEAHPASCIREEGMIAMYVLAVTGGIGSGKSVAAGRFAEHGARVLDLDAIAKELLAEDASVRARVVDGFGTGVLGRDGKVVPDRLAAVAFASDAAAEILNAAIHPAAVAYVSDELGRIATTTPAAVVVLDVPLLVETPALQMMSDQILTIEAQATVRLERLEAVGMPKQDVLARMDRQSCHLERAAIADTVLDNSGSIEMFLAAVDQFWVREIVPRIEKDD